MHFNPTTIPHEIRRDMIYFRSVAVPNDITGGARLICHEIEKEAIGSKCGREEFSRLNMDIFYHIWFISIYLLLTNKTQKQPDPIKNQ